MKLAYPVELDVGQAHLFNQESIHGNINNTTEVTRMALDWHILPKEESFIGVYLEASLGTQMTIPLLK